MFAKLLSLAVFALAVDYVLSHGMLMDPLNRSSMWRIDNTSRINYNDNQNFCGGRAIQWEMFNGGCGVCGDRFDAPHPQDNENTGIFGEGKISRTYLSGSKIDVTVLLTSNHLGNFKYGLCVLEDPSQPEVGEECFKPLILGDGTLQYNVTAHEEYVTHSLILPYGLKCERCVLRWHYSAGNSWGDCGDGHGAMGCGPQETFRSCSDIAIV